MGEKSGPVPKVICVKLRSSKLYFQMFVRPFTDRANSRVFPGSAHAAPYHAPPYPKGDSSPKSTAAWLVRFILKIGTFGESVRTPATSKSSPPGKNRSGFGIKDWPAPAKL